jgi:hypothetical protein
MIQATASGSMLIFIASIGIVKTQGMQVGP